VPPGVGPKFKPQYHKKKKKKKKERKEKKNLELLNKPWVEVFVQNLAS
jgi:hypothetical protein